jgi:signal transduction histidine kinase
LPSLWLWNLGFGWATKQAIISYIILILLLVYIIYKYINTRIKEKRELSTERKEYKQFEALNAKKIQFFTNISHEFRTPLTLILTPLEDIIEEDTLDLPQSIKEKHNIIYKNAKRLSRLINELMDFRKLQFNKMSINASQINIVPFIEEVVGHFEEEASLNNILLSVEYDQYDLIIWSDPSMLEKITFNLLSNAFKATPAEGLITIQISNPSDLIHLPLVHETNPVKAIEIIIKDTGLGIKKENLTKVFDRFYQANEMNEQYYGGTGIGLELVKSFVDLHKGKIVLTSKENIGTQFKIYFPLGYSHLKENNINKDQEKAINQYSDSQNEHLKNHGYNSEENESKKTILIVEDNIELRTYVKNELKNEYIIKEAEGDMFVKPFNFLNKLDLLSPSTLSNS